ncbi:hypothetical protein BDN72DRAFT_863846 [Pluteus cervinus]|uniref:Uncharacterized protein n=1 Tax=Pluteus cervinus TaxID=181527 RepID=A0ACD3A8G3_9AGAR|nr:hypothetical protein BDN72DRAFT_863846 [Pluteus cervinus]
MERELNKESGKNDAETPYRACTSKKVKGRYRSGAAQAGQNQVRRYGLGAKSTYPPPIALLVPDLSPKSAVWARAGGRQATCGLRVSDKNSCSALVFGFVSLRHPAIHRDGKLAPKTKMTERWETMYHISTQPNYKESESCPHLERRQASPSDIPQAMTTRRGSLAMEKGEWVSGGVGGADRH